MKRGHFFDIDVIINKNEMVWIVNKDNPNYPLMKLSKSDFNLIKSGIYRSQNNKIEFNGKVYWISTDLFNKIKIKAKNSDVDLSSIGISLQEFLNKDIIENLEYVLDIDQISFLKNTHDDLYIICSKEIKNTHSLLIKKLKNELKEQGLNVKSFYHISESFYNQNADDVKLKKQKLLIQHSIGYKTDDNVFTNEEITKYDEVLFYDNNYDTLSYVSDINRTFNSILFNTENGLKSVIEEDVKEYNPFITIVQIYTNEINKSKRKSLHIKVSNLISFESFKY